jgi:spore germination protein GerM
VPLALKRTDSTRLDLYFHNNDLDPEISCTKVFSITKNIITTQSPARAAMIMLLQGSSDSERETNYYSAIPFRSFLKDISLSDDGVATVDLGGAVAGPLGGSCLVGGIAAEIENTLKQFPEVKEVKILIDGKENALQP